MNLNKIEELSASELGELVNKKQVSPTELVKYFAQRIEKYNSDVNAFVYTKIDEALIAAKIVEDRILKGEFVGPFAGVPFALKDFLPSKKGWTHSHGGVKCLIKEDPYSSVFCEAMEAAGGVAIGKTNSPAYGFRGTCDNKLYGATKNPFNTRFNSGGSSGGSASAVSAGLIPIAEGGDAGGSIRIPAAWCGCFGYKASIGTIPSVCRPDGWSATHPYCFNGGLTKTVTDAAILLNHMAKYDPRDPLSVPRNPIDYEQAMQQSIKGWKIAIVDFDLFAVEPEVLQIVANAANRFTEAGAEVTHITYHPDYLNLAEKDIADAWCYGICVDTAIELRQWKAQGFDLIKDHADELPEAFITWHKKVDKGGIMDFYNFNTVRTKLLDLQQDLFDKYDIIITPTATCLPVLNQTDGDTKGPEYINGKKINSLIGFAETYIFNMTGNPAASIPAGFSQSGLPVGMQIVGKRFCDSDVLRAAYAFEQIQPWRASYSRSYRR